MNEKDLKIDTYSNNNSKVVRVTHLPTGKKCTANTKYEAIKTLRGMVEGDSMKYHRRHRNDDALYNRPAEPGSAEYDYLHRYDSPDNQRDTMG